MEFIPVSNVKPVRLRTQKIIPLTYDDSLSYMEVLSKLAAKVNEIITDVNDHMDDYLTEYIEQNLDDLYANISYNVITHRLEFTLRTGE